MYKKIGKLLFVLIYVFSILLPLTNKPLKTNAFEDLLHKKRFSEIVLPTNDPENPIWVIKVAYFDV